MKEGSFLLFFYLQSFGLQRQLNNSVLPSMSLVIKQAHMNCVHDRNFSRTPKL